MSNERDIKKLLQHREALERRIVELEMEVEDLRKAVSIIDGMVVTDSFRTPTVSATPPAPAQEPPQPETLEESTSITSKDGTVLGRMYVEGKDLFFRPQPEFHFTVEIPPFQSFFIERVLANMNTTDQERAANGEIDPSDILEYEVVEEEEGALLEVHVMNYGGERRLREINSSLRWTFDKMYDKLRQG